MPKNSPLAISSEISVTACSSSYSVERKGCRARSLSVEYCWWGRRKDLLTFSIETAIGVACALALGAADSRGIVVGKGYENASNAARGFSGAFEHVDVLVVLVAAWCKLKNAPVGAKLREHPLR